MIRILPGQVSLVLLAVVPCCARYTKIERCSGSRYTVQLRQCMKQETASFGSAGGPSAIPTVDEAWQSLHTAVSGRISDCQKRHVSTACRSGLEPGLNLETGRRNGERRTDTSEHWNLLPARLMKVNRLPNLGGSDQVPRYLDLGSHSGKSWNKEAKSYRRSLPCGTLSLPPPHLQV